MRCNPALQSCCSLGSRRPRCRPRTPRRTHTPSCPPSQRRSQDSCCRRRRPAPPCTCLSPHNSHTRAVSAATMRIMACRAAVHAAAQGPAALTCLAGRAVAGAHPRGGALGGACGAAGGARVPSDAGAFERTFNPKVGAVPKPFPRAIKCRIKRSSRVVPGAARLVPPVAGAI